MSLLLAILIAGLIIWSGLVFLMLLAMLISWLWRPRGATGGGNTFIGKSVGSTITTGENNVMIGHRAKDEEQ